jgi:hypothetical protein
VAGDEAEGGGGEEAGELSPKIGEVRKSANARISPVLIIFIFVS